MNEKEREQQQQLCDPDTMTTGRSAAHQASEWLTFLDRLERVQSPPEHVFEQLRADAQFEATNIERIRTAKTTCHPERERERKSERERKEIASAGEDSDPIHSASPARTENRNSALRRSDACARVPTVALAERLALEERRDGGANDGGTGGRTKRVCEGEGKGARARRNK